MAKEGKRNGHQFPRQKKRFNPLIDNNCKFFTLTDIAKALEDVAPQSIIFTAVPKPKVDFVREVLTKNTKKSANVPSIDDVILMSQSIKSFTENMSKNMTVDNIEIIESSTHGQSSN